MKKNYIAFTLSEVLITLGIIGVVAAMTLPTLISKYQKKVIATKLLKTYSMLEQAVKMSEVYNGPVKDWNIPLQSVNNDESGKLDWGKNRQMTYNLVATYIAPYLKYTEFKWDNSNVSMYLNNGTVLRFWRGNCLDTMIDTNGDTLPNKDGYDVFRVVICQDSRGFTVYGRDKYATREQLLNNCKAKDSIVCLALIERDGWKISDDYPYPVR